MKNRVITLIRFGNCWHLPSLFLNLWPFSEFYVIHFQAPKFSRAKYQQCPWNQQKSINCSQRKWISLWKQIMLFCLLPTTSIFALCCSTHAQIKCGYNIMSSLLRPQNTDDKLQLHTFKIFCNTSKRHLSITIKKNLFWKRCISQYHKLIPSILPC